MQRDQRVYLKDILDSAKKIEKYVKDLTYDDFELDEKIIDAVIRNFEIIGEASRNVLQELRDKYSKIPWNNMISMRNILSHEYYQVGLNIVWDTIKEDIPKVKFHIENILKDIKDIEEKKQDFK